MSPMLLSKQIFIKLTQNSQLAFSQPNSNNSPTFLLITIKLHQLYFISFTISQQLLSSTPLLPPTSHHLAHFLMQLSKTVMLTKPTVFADRRHQIETFSLQIPSMFYTLFFRFASGSLRAFQNCWGKQRWDFKNTATFKQFASASSIYILKRMSQENMWVMIYILPQFINFEPQQLNYELASSTKIVEQGICYKNMEPIKSLKSTPEETKPKKQNCSLKCPQKLVEDSSFQIPIKQENKAAQQKLGRNSVSNILRLFTKLLKTIILKEKYERVKEKYKFQVSLKEFNSWINCIGLNTNKYIRIKKVLNGIKSKPHLGLIVGIFYSIFEADFARLAVLTSSKTETKNIMPTLAQIRNIREEFDEAIKMSLTRPCLNKSNVFN